MKTFPFQQKYSSLEVSDSAIITQAKEDVIAYNSDGLADADFNPTTVIVVTWENVGPYARSSDTEVSVYLTLKKP